jgi:hypothetical protein
MKLFGNMKEINTKHYFLIETTDSERSSSYKKICDSYEEAIEQVPNYYDWYCHPGTCTVVEVDSNFKTIKSWRFWKGELEVR